MTWSQAVREALCFGWIDGIVKRIDDERYQRRFTPRKPRSIWSSVNVKHANELIAEGKMHPAGHAAFSARTENRSGIYSFEQRSVELPEQYATTLHSNKKALAYWEKAPASYRKAAMWWIISAKQEPTRVRRLALLMECSENGERIPMLTPSGVKPLQTKSAAEKAQKKSATKRSSKSNSPRPKKRKSS